MKKVSGENLLARFRMRYRKAKTRKEKSLIIDELCHIMNLKSRKHAIRLLNSRKEGTSSKRNKSRPGPRKTYTLDFRDELVRIWRILSYSCSLHLKAELPIVIPMMERNGYRFNPDTKELLLRASRSTIERTLSPIRPQEKGRVPRRGYRLNTLAREVPLAIDYPRPHEPGHIQVDLVHFAGGDGSGHYIHMVIAVDIMTGYFEAEPCMGRSRSFVLDALSLAVSRFPFKVKTLQTDNGPEFMNHHLSFFCEESNITFLRSRKYHKNDNAYAEGLIGNVIRKELGYLRYETPEALETMRLLCRGPLRILYNFLKCTAKYRKEKINGKTRRIPDQPRPPAMRVLESISNGDGVSLTELYETIDPFAIDEEKRLLVSELLKQAEKVGASRETQSWQDTDNQDTIPSSSTGDRLAHINNRRREDAMS